MFAGEEPQPQSWPFSQHQCTCQITEVYSQEVEEIAMLSKVGLAPSLVLAAIKDKFPSSLITLQSVYNKCARLTREMLKGHTAVQALLEVLQAKGVKHMVRFNT